METNNSNSNSSGNVNVARETVNKNVSRFGMLGKAKRFSWNAKRSYRGY
jgi:hypothetical protein